MHKRHRILSVFLVMVILFSAVLTTFSTASAAGPDTAVVPTGDWDQLDAGESRWYAFEYAGDGSQIQVRLQVVPESNAGFVVWTPEQIYHWGLGEYVEPIGRGSPDPFAEGVLSWLGSFNTPGTYYAVVEHASEKPGMAYYLLEIHGEGVSFATSRPTAEPTPEPAPPRTKAASPSKMAGKLVFQTTFGGPFYVVNADGSGLRRMTDGIDPIWSPDASQIAFVRWREPRGVWVVEVGTGNEWRAFDWNEARWPSWSADGSRILFSRQHGGRTEEIERCFWGFCFTIGPDPNWKLGIVRPGDGDFREPPCSESSLAPEWSPVEDRIVYADRHGLRVQSEDGAVSYLITHDARDTGPTWSPDGQQVAFTRRQHDHWEVYVVGADGRNLRRLTDTPRQPDGDLGNSAAPAWSPDGQHLAFLTDRSGRWDIWVMAASDGSGQRPMCQGALDGLTLEYVALGERVISWTR